MPRGARSNPTFYHVPDKNKRKKETEAIQQKSNTESKVKDKKGDAPDNKKKIEKKSASEENQTNLTKQYDNSEVNKETEEIKNETRDQAESEANLQENRSKVNTGNIGESEANTYVESTPGNILMNSSEKNQRYYKGTDVNQELVKDKEENIDSQKLNNEQVSQVCPKECTNTGNISDANIESNKNIYEVSDESGIPNAVTNQIRTDEQQSGLQVQESGVQGEAYNRETKENVTSLDNQDRVRDEKENIDAQKSNNEQVSQVCPKKCPNTENISDANIESNKNIYEVSDDSGILNAVTNQIRTDEQQSGLQVQESEDQGEAYDRETKEKVTSLDNQDNVKDKKANMDAQKSNNEQVSQVCPKKCPNTETISDANIESNNSIGENMREVFDESGIPNTNTVSDQIRTDEQQSVQQVQESGDQGEAYDREIKVNVTGLDNQDRVTDKKENTDAQKSNNEQVSQVCPKKCPNTENISDANIENNNSICENMCKVSDKSGITNTDQIPTDEQQSVQQVQESEDQGEAYDRETKEKITSLDNQDHVRDKEENIDAQKTNNEQVSQVCPKKCPNTETISDASIESNKNVCEVSDKSGVTNQISTDEQQSGLQVQESRLRDTNNGGVREEPICRIVQEIANESIGTITDLAINILKEMIDQQRDSLSSIMKTVENILKNEINKIHEHTKKNSDGESDLEKSNAISEVQMDSQITTVSKSNVEYEVEHLQDEKPSEDDRLTAVMPSPLTSSSSTEELKVDCQNDDTDSAENKENGISIQVVALRSNGEQEYYVLADASNDKNVKESLNNQSEPKISWHDGPIQTVTVIDDVRQKRLNVYKKLEMRCHDAENQVIVSIRVPMLKMQEPHSLEDTLDEKEEENLNNTNELKGEHETIASNDASKIEILAKISEEENSSHSEELAADSQEGTEDNKNILIAVFKPNGDVLDDEKAEGSLELQSDAKAQDDLMKTETMTTVVSKSASVLYNEVEIKSHGNEDQESVLIRLPMLNTVQEHSLGETLDEKEDTSVFKNYQETIVQDDKSKIDTVALISEEQVQSDEDNKSNEQPNNETIEDEKSIIENNDITNKVDDEASAIDDVVIKEALRFHPIHGTNIKLSDNGFRAQRKNSSKFFGQGITFSSRPVRLQEKIYIQLEEISDHWVGCLTFGFTNKDPHTLAGILPSVIITDLENKPGYWAGHLAKTFCRKNNIFHYYINSTGTVSYGINGIDKGTLFWNVNTTEPVWAMIELFGYFTAVKLIDYTTSGISSSENNEKSVDIISPISKLPIPRLRYQSSIRLMPLKLHTTKGKNVRTLEFKGVAARSEYMANQGYVFTNNPMRADQTIVIQILCTGPGYEFLPLGLTCCDPTLLEPSDLPDSAEALVEWGQNWVVFKNVANFVRAGDELAVTRTHDGDIRIRKNNGEPITLMRVDRKIKFWMFLEMFGAIRMVRMWTTINRNDRTFGLRRSLSRETI